MTEISSSKNEVSLAMVYKEIVRVRKKLETFEDIIIPKEEVSKSELEEIEQLKKESFKGENVQWDKLKKELSL
ncbi:MAG: hypothetical protein O8C66_06355 [Candidatus Methanoperedens sp.]|nr:hypothetical protein [Candidatus Methanoperedens sp.]MCZ7370112.1 hypothetical protein [Candidatus Methanoperedens sp.]